MDYITIPGIDAPYKLTRLSGLNIEGMMPLRNIRELSPRHVGTRIVSTFKQERRGSITLNVPKTDKAYILNLFSPDRVGVFNKPFIYHKETLGGNTHSGGDGVTVSGSGYFLSETGRFVDVGGLQKGSYITIDGVPREVVEHYSDSVIVVDYVFPNDATNVSWSYISDTVYRTLEFNIDGGFIFLRTTSENLATVEVIDIVAGNPYWLGYRQEIIWADLFTQKHKIYPMRYPEWELYDEHKKLLTITVYMSGDSEVKPSFRLQGLIDTFLITNGATNKKLLYDDLIPRDKYVVIDLQNATAMLYPDEIDVLHKVKGDLTSFTLIPFVPNEVTVNIESVTETSEVSMYWKNLYLGSNNDRV